MDKTSARSRDLLIRRLYDERHRLMREQRIGNRSDDAAIRRVEEQINKHEMAAHRERFPNGTPMQIWIRETEAALAKIRARLPPPGGEGPEKP